MKIPTTLVSLVALLSASTAALGAVYINEVLPNSPGGDTGNEFFELRGTPNMSLAGYYLVSVEGQGTGTPGKGDINQLFDLGAFSLGANGYLFARQAGSQFSPTDPNATVIENTVGTGWGQANAGGVGSSVGHYSDGSQVDIENGATTILLITKGTGIEPTNTLDLDTDNDGFLDLPEGWTVVDSVGIMDGQSPTATTESSYGVITFRAPGTNGLYWGSSVYGNIINVPGPMTTTAGTFHVGRKGESTGSTSNDWVGSIVDGSAGAPLNFYFYSSSDPAFAGMPVSAMVYGGTNASAAPLGTLPYTPTIHGTRFTNYTQLALGGPIGDVAVDPRDNTTILYTVDNDVGGGIYRAYKVASGNWWADSAPIVSGLDRPSGLVVQSDGTIWWVHDVTMALVRLKAPWASNTPEIVVTNFGNLVADDDPFDLTFAPSNFSGPPGQPGWIVVADRGSDDNANNALNLLDPATTELFQTNNNFLVSPSAFDLGFSDLNAIGSLPASGEVVTLSSDGWIGAVTGSGIIRRISPTTLWATTPTTTAAAMAVDPNTGRVWVSDDTLDQVWSVDPAAVGQTADVQELSFPLVDPALSYRQMNFHEPGMAFAPDGSFLIVSDTSTAGGGGRLLIFHKEPFVPFSLSSFSITNVTQTAQGPLLEWTPAGAASFNIKYSIQRATDVTQMATASTIATVNTTWYTDTNAPAEGAFYRVLAKP